MQQGLARATATIVCYLAMLCPQLPSQTQAVLALGTVTA